MDTFFAIARRSWQRYLTYRAATIAGFITNFIFGIMRVSILLALYGDRTSVEGYTISGILTYTALSQAIIAYLSFFGWFALADSIYNGDIAVDLLKPIPLFRLWLAQDLGRALVNLLLRGVTILICYALIFDLTFPTTLPHIALISFTLIISWLLSFMWRFLINLTALWSPNARGFIRFGFVISWFASGFMMPLRFFPPWLQQILYLTPFPHLLNSVVEVYLGLLTGPDLYLILAQQIAWCLGLYLIIHLTLQRGIRRLVILGG
ncbi:MAG TPA: ABC-2 family transporter protein [Anaerolineae bacterium]|nr:ABC-2 family transporter protein [Anaerolineae bacterium]